MSTIDDKKIPAETKPLEDTTLADVSGSGNGTDSHVFRILTSEQEPSTVGTEDFRPVGRILADDPSKPATNADYLPETN